MEVGGGPAGLADIPLIEVGHLRGQSAGATSGWVQHWGQGGTHGSPHRRVAQASWRRWWGLAVDLHVFPQRAGVGVGLITTSNLAIVGFVAGVHMGMFLSVAAVGELPVATIKFTFERLFPCNETQERSTMAFQKLLTGEKSWRKAGNTISHFPIDQIPACYIFLIPGFRDPKGARESSPGPEPLLGPGLGSGQMSAPAAPHGSGRDVTARVSPGGYPTSRTPPPQQTHTSPRKHTLKHTTAEPPTPPRHILKKSDLQTQGNMWRFKKKKKHR